MSKVNCTMIIIFLPEMVPTQCM